mmetsp:Transcript_12238/g.19250  ORF Transcript_12238/g.19250 Transcript_12238/m.19250 type:complete len:395 (+) Transcript_12238:248-1432(+)
MEIQVSAAATAAFGISYFLQEPKIGYQPECLPVLDRKQYVYDVKQLKGPHLYGLKLKIMLFLLEVPLVAPVLKYYLLLKQNVGTVRQMAAALPCAPMIDPRRPITLAEKSTHEQYAEERGLKWIATMSPSPSPVGCSFRHWNSADFVQAYAAGRTTPSEVVARVIAAIHESNSGNKPLRAFIAVLEEDAYKQANDSTARWQRGQQLGPLDGVPIAVKDQIDVKGHENSQGTNFAGPLLGKALEDGLLVARMKAQGAIVVGKVGMHEIGIGVLGHNVHHGPFRNPHNTDRYPGGSSAGSGAAVAAGLVPITLGADGGGSIRIPAAMNGVFGLKTTFQRCPCPSTKTLENCTSSVGVGKLDSQGNQHLDMTITLAGLGPDGRQYLRRGFGISCNGW